LNVSVKIRFKCPFTLELEKGAGGQNMPLAHHLLICHNLVEKVFLALEKIKQAKNRKMSELSKV
jgi:hypothetical protein